MKFNKIIRGAKREVNSLESVYAILDDSFLCHVAFQSNGQTMMIPTAYGRKGNYIYMHGSVKNYMLNEISKGQQICVSVTHLDGIVLARTLFDTSANYRSVVLFGTASKVTDEEERIEALKIITENIIPGRWDEVPVGSNKEIEATQVIKFIIESASAKIREGAPQGDEQKTNEVWSGYIPLQLKALEPIQDDKFTTKPEINKSVEDFLQKHK